MPPRRRGPALFIGAPPWWIVRIGVSIPLFPPHSETSHPFQVFDLERVTWIGAVLRSFESRAARSRPCHISTRVLWPYPPSILLCISPAATIPLEPVESACVRTPSHEIRYTHSDSLNSDTLSSDSVLSCHQSKPCACPQPPGVYSSHTWGISDAQHGSIFLPMPLPAHRHISQAVENPSAHLNTLCCLVSVVSCLSNQLGYEPMTSSLRRTG